MRKEPQTERGSITAFVAVLAITFIACAGLAVDGGRLVAARVQLADHAENAARAVFKRSLLYVAVNPILM
jgi:Flp pilus assembly protein TadG